MNFKLVLILLLSFVISTVCAQSTVRSEIDSLTRLIQNERDDSVRHRLMRSKARRWEVLNKDSAMAIINEVIDESIKLNNDYSYAASLEVRGIIFYLNGLTDEAVRDYEEALSILEQSGYGKLKAACLNDLSLAYKRLGNIEKCLDLMYESIEIRRKLEIIPDLINSFINVAHIHASVGEYDLALKSLQEVEQNYLTQMNTSQRLSLFHNLASNYYRTERSEKAEEYINRQLEVARKIKSPAHIASGLNLLGLIKKGRGNYKKAISVYEESLSFSRLSGSKNTLGSTLNNLGRVYLLDKRPLMAIKYLRDSEVLFRSLSSSESLEITYFNLMLAYSALQNSDSMRYYDNQYTLLKHKRFSDQVADMKSEWEVKLNLLENELELKKEQAINLEASNRIKNLFILFILTGALFGVFVYLFRASQKKRFLVQIEKEQLDELNKELVQKTEELRNSLSSESEKASRVIGENQLKLIACWKEILLLSLRASHNRERILQKRVELFQIFDLIYPDFHKKMSGDFQEWDITERQLSLCKLYSQNWFDTNAIISTQISTLDGLKQLKRIIRRHLEVSSNLEVYKKLRNYL